MQIICDYPTWPTIEMLIASKKFREGLSHFLYNFENLIAHLVANTYPVLINLKLVIPIFLQITLFLTLPAVCIYVEIEITI